MYNYIDTPLKYRIKAICKHIGKDKNSGHYIIYGLRGDQVFFYK